MFASTQEAVYYGLEASPDERKMLLSLRERYLYDLDISIERGLFDEASVHATKAQFCREALEAREIVKNNPELF